MAPYLLTFAVGLVLALALTPAVRLRAGAGTQRRHGERERPAPGVAQPGTPGRVEKPRIGGLVIFVAFAATPFVASLVSPTVSDFVEPKWREITGLLATAFVVFLFGYIDDVHELGWLPKSGGLIAAGVILYALGYRLGEISLPGGGAFSFGPLDLPATVAWVWLVSNAINLLDGHDGVAGGVTALTAGALALVAWDLDHFLVTILFASLAGAVAGFLPFNFPSASRFLGDSGALLLGFLLAALAISGFVDETGRIPLYIPIVALGVPLLDIGLAFSRRLLNGRHPFHADLDHVHHRIERMLGYGPRRLALTLYGFSTLFAAAAVALHAWSGTMWVWPVSVGLIALTATFIVRLGYHETLIDSLTVRRMRGRLWPSASAATADNTGVTPVRPEQATGVSNRH